MAYRRFKSYRYDRRRRRSVQPWLFLLAFVLLGLITYRLGQSHSQAIKPAAVDRVATSAESAGKVLSLESVRNYSPAEALSVARQNYGAVAIPSTTGVTKVVFRYRSYDLNGDPIVIYARAYLPNDRLNLPIFAFAPGTTGIGDVCAGSIEQPAKINWGNYDSHMMMYASQGYASVITDYEGMRDPARLHHYMVGALEGRAMLDSIRGLENLKLAQGRLDTSAIILGGYSQGGHAAFWADKIAGDYAPDIKVSGVVGWGPVMNVRETLADVARGANINWFGPYVLTSYLDYYHHGYDLAAILQPVWIPHLSQQVESHCIDTDIPFWGRNPDKVYQLSFLTSISGPTFARDFPELALDLERNAADDAHTTSAKLINQGNLDNVVLPAQQQAALPLMCKASLGPVQLHAYAATHYDNMVLSFRDTVAWMQVIRGGARPPSSCPPAGI